MTQTFFIPCVFAGFNECIAAAKSGRGKGNGYSRLKAALTGVVENYARSYCVKPMQGKVDVLCEWDEPTARRDPDNVESAIKFVLDGLVKAGVIAGDGHRHIGRITQVVTVRQFCQPGVRVTMSTDLG